MDIKISLLLSTELIPSIDIGPLISKGLKKTMSLNKEVSWLHP